MVGRVCQLSNPAEWQLWQWAQLAVCWPLQCPVTGSPGPRPTLCAADRGWPFSVGVFCDLPPVHRDKKTGLTCISRRKLACKTCLVMSRWDKSSDWLHSTRMVAYVLSCVCVCVCVEGLRGELSSSEILYTGRLRPLDLWTRPLAAGRNRRQQTCDEHALAPSRCTQNKYYTLFWRHRRVGGGGGDNALWSNILIIPLSSLSPPLHPFARPRACSLSHSLPLTPSPSHTPPPLLDRGTGEIIIMFWHMALAPRALGF